MDDLSPQDSDLITRTVIGEARGESDVGKAAVAHVVLNRLKAGGYGDDVKQILFRPKQFEPWNTRAKELLSYTDQDPVYSKTKQIVDDVITGKISDPTNGATHFANIDEVKKRGNRSAMKWISGMENVNQIGNHTFGNADAGRTKMAATETYKDLIDEFGPSNKTEGKPEDFSDLIKEFGGKGSPAAVETAPVVAEVKKPLLQKAYVPTEGMTPEQQDAQTLQAKEIAKNAPTKTQEILGLPSKVIGNVGIAVGKNFIEAKKTAGEGFTAISENRPAEGVGKIGLGLLQGAVAPISGAADELIAKPVTELTGNPTIGDKAAFVATSGLPVNKLAKSVQAARPTEKAVANIVDAIGTENIPAVVERLRANPRLSIADVSPGAQQLAQKLVVTEGPHQNKLSKFVEDRANTAKGAVENAVDSTMGAPVNVLKKLEDMKASAKEVGAKEINPIVEKAGVTDVTDVVNHIDKAIASGGPVEKATLKALKEGKEPSLSLSEAQSKLFQIRERIRGDWKDNPQMFLDAKGEQGAHEIQKSLRAEAQSLLDSATPSDRALGKKIMDIRNKLVDAIDAKSNGKYKEGLGKYADEMHIQEAFDKGTNILKNPTKLENRPEFLEDWWKKAKPAEKEAIKEGIRVAYDGALRGYKTARKAEDVVAVDFNVKNLETVFGKTEANKMARALHDEKAIADNNVKLLHGSQTAMRMKNDSRVDLPVKGVGGGFVKAGIAEGINMATTGLPGLGGALYYGGKAVEHVAHKVNVNLAKKTNNAMTDLITAPAGPQRDKLIDLLSSYIPGPKTPMRQKIVNRLQNVIAP